jgi:1-acyl-sn-glycerol-3-phosphate acyltransferase
MPGTLHPYVSWTFPVANAFFLKEAFGVENIPEAGPFILASNHISIPDEWVMNNVVYPISREPIWFIARDDIWWGKWWVEVIKNSFALLIVDWRKPSAVLDEAEKILYNGGVVGVYPEGTRNLDPEALALGKTGIARLALATGAPIIPVGYFGPPIATAWDVVKNFVLARNTVTLHFGKALHFSEQKDKPITRELLYEITDNIMIEIGKLCNKRPRLH